MDNGTKLKKHRRIRLIIAAVAAAVQNGYIIGFTKGKIFTGISKYGCVPSLNCYSCPGALGACPVGSLQNSLSSGQFKAVLYVLGFITVFGAVFGRIICGFICPFGLLQELLFKIPFVKKIRKLPGERFLRLLKYVFLILFVILFPMIIADVSGVGDPWFCKYVCPAGTLEGGVPLVLLNEGLKAAVGFLYTYKIIILLVVIIASVILFRPFCRYICPLGAIYGLFNKASLARFKVDTAKCTKCKACQNTCKLDIPVYLKPNSIDCIRCGDCIKSCPTGAIDSLFIKNKL